MTEPIAELRPVRWTPNTPIPPFLFITTIDLSSSDVTRYNPEGRTAASNKGEDDEYSDENIRRWEEADKLDPALAEWVNAQLGE
jgi:hypothetical protein